MKTNLLKSILTIAFFAFAGIGAFAQVNIASLPTYDITLPSDTSSKADTVSLNAVMPYFVHPDATIKNSPLFNNSGFKWTIAGAGATLNTGSLTASPVAATGYYTDTMVMATFPNTGNVTISTIERSNPKFNATAGCDGNQRDLTVNVIALPTVPTIANTDTAQGGCSAAAPYTVNFNFSASTTKFPVYVNYTIQYYDINNVAGGTPQSLIYQINSASDHVIVSQAQLDAASGGSSLSGRYVVKLGNMWDRISVRSTNAATLAVDASSVYGAIMLFPTPVTQPIKHIKTL